MKVVINLQLKKVIERLENPIKYFGEDAAVAINNRNAFIKKAFEGATQILKNKLGNPTLQLRSKPFFLACLIKSTPLSELTKGMCNFPPVYSNI